MEGIWTEERKVVSIPPPRLTGLFGEISIQSRYVYIALKKGKEEKNQSNTSRA